jgi:S-sulfo-L-cysteine synthase (3-phospho-L-serine-dependent)
MRKPWIVFIESNTTGTGRCFVHTATQLGLAPVVLAENPDRYPYIREDGIPCVEARTSNLDNLAHNINLLARQAAIQGIYSSSEYFVEIAAQLARARGLSGADPEAIRICRNKRRQREHLRTAGIGTPNFISAECTQKAVEALELIPLPAIVKPVMGTGSTGVRLCHTPQEVITHTTRLLSSPVNERNMAVPREVLVEEYLNGLEYSAEVLNAKVMGFARKHISSEPHFVELGHDFPADLTNDTIDLACAVITSAVAAIGLTWGPAHVEFRITPRGPAIIEINPRLAGGYIPEIVRLASGLDLIRATVALVTGISQPLSISLRKHASIRFITPPFDGVLEGFNGLTQAAQTTGVQEVRLYRKPGEYLQIQNDFRDRIGHVIAVASALVTSAHIAEEARAAIRVIIAPKAA